MDRLSNNCPECAHKKVCGKYRVTGGVGKCSDFMEEPKKGRWVYTGEVDHNNNAQAFCSICGAGDNHAISMKGKVLYCWKCGSFVGEDIVLGVGDAEEGKL